MRILVTGALGFVGLNVVRTLAKSGHEVVALDRSAVDVWVSEFLRDVSESVSHLSADLASPGALAGASSIGPIDAVVHAAVITATTLGVEVERARDIVDSNIGGTVDVLETAVELGARRFVYVSSPSALGEVESTTLIGEDAPANPRSLYGITKLASEMIVARWGELRAIETVSVRIAQPYGPGERATSTRVRTSPIWEWLRDIERGEPLPTGPLDVSRDWTYIDDTARGIEMLATAESTPHQLYHLGTGQEAFVGDVVSALRSSGREVVVDEHPPADVINPNIAGASRRPLDPSRFERDFEWKPSTGIGEGMERYIAWWADFRSLVGSDL